MLATAELSVSQKPSPMPEPAALPLDTFLALLLVASATAVCIKWVKVPYAVALVLAGLAIGLLNVLPPVSMTPELVLMVFLPALLFEASWNLDLRALRRDWLPIGVLATVGVILCMFSVAAILHLVGNVDFSTALLFGAMVSATDPVSVIALFREMGIDKRLTMILEGESLFNDGTAVVLFYLVLGIVTTGASWSIPSAIGSFCLVVFGGAGLGALLGFAASRITTAFDDHLLEITLTVVTAYGSFLLADHLKVSPVIAVVCAGIVVGNYGSRTGMSATTRLAVNSFWEYAAFLVNSLLFLLIGLQVKVNLLMHHAPLIGLGVVAVMVARMMTVYGLCPFVSTDKLPIPDKWRHLLFWGGLRGALVMALALSLPLDFPNREAVINMTFGVVLFTLLIPGLTMEPLVRFMGMIESDRSLAEYEEGRCLLVAYKAELHALSEMQRGGRISQKVASLMEQQLISKINVVQKKLEHLEISEASLEELHLRQAKSYLLHFRKETLSQMAKSGLLSSESFHNLKVDIDNELESIGEGGDNLSITYASTASANTPDVTLLSAPSDVRSVSEHVARLVESPEYGKVTEKEDT